MAGKGGGAWKVAYADFVTAMMAFFLVMWIVAQNKPVKEAVAGYFRDPYGTGGTKPGGTGNLPGVEETKAKSKSKQAGRTGGKLPSIAVLRGQTGTAIGAAILFPENSAELDPTAELRLKELAPMIRGYSAKIEIRAHAAKRRASDAEGVDPWELCYQRSLAAMRFLTKEGVEPDRLRLSQSGPNEPCSTTKDALSRKQNSRVEIYMLGEHANNQNGSDGEAKPEGDNDSAKPAASAKTNADK